MPEVATLNLTEAEIEALIGVAQQAAGLTVRVRIADSVPLPEGTTARAMFRQDLLGAVVEDLDSTEQDSRLTVSGQVVTIRLPGSVSRAWRDLDYRTIQAEGDWPAHWGDQVVGFTLSGSLVVTRPDGTDFKIDLRIVWEASYLRTSA